MPEPFYRRTPTAIARPMRRPGRVPGLARGLTPGVRLRHAGACGTRCPGPVVRSLRWLGRLLLASLAVAPPSPWAAPAPAVRLEPRDIALVVNLADPLSLQVAEYYQARRGIPREHVIAVEFPPGSPELPVDAFARLYPEVVARTPAAVQAYALTWAAPYRVGCMSITSAFALGFDPAYCATGCRPTKASAYFNSPSQAPFRDLRVRPTMAIAATSIREATRLIDRGVAADGTRPAGTAYLVSTSDRARNVRAALYPAARDALRGRFRVRLVEGDALGDRTDVMFYFTGLTQVEGLASLTFRPGAVADHLTSLGGQLTDSPQMSSLRWLEAGATGSYGSVVEPCNLLPKFPHPGILMTHYLAGATLIEAYWKSVAWPGQGIFVGEPLASPFGPARRGTGGSD